MELNQFLFPAPVPSYSCKGHLGELIYIPKYKQDPITKELIQFKNPAEVSKNIKIFGQQQANNEGLAAPNVLGKKERAAPTITSDQKPFPKTNGPQSTMKDSVTQKLKDMQLQKNQDSGLAVPCLFMPYQAGSSKVLIFFHGNAEDVGLAMDLLVFIRDMLQVHVMAMEYPGYGVYQHMESSAAQIAIDAQNVFDYLTIVIGMKDSDILLFGRSIGTGPATIVAANRKPGALILMSAFKSIRDIVREQAGSLLQYVMSDRFRNIDAIAEVTCPTFLVHGQQDQLIPFEHSQSLFKKCKGTTTLTLPRMMDHNEFDFVEDLISPLHNFMVEVEIDVKPVDGDEEKGQIQLPEELYIPPQAWLKQEIELMREHGTGQQNGKVPPPQRIGLWNWFLRKFLM